jgi:L-fuconolactonase
VTRGVVDAHVHLWRHADLAPGQVVADARLRHDFLWRDFRAASAGLGVDAAVAVAVREGGGPNGPDGGLAEPAFLTGAAPLAAITAWAPLDAPGVGAHLAALRADPLVRAVRRATQDEPDPGFCASPAFVRGVREAGRHGFLVEVCARHHQLAAVAELAAACPEARIVLDHLGKPDLADRDPAAWRRDVARLAALPNVACKVSVVVQRPGDAPLTAAAAAPFVEHVIERFGWDRVLFGSNWPVSTVVVGYRAWVELLHRLLAGSRAEHLDALFSGTARRLYGI